MPPLITFPAEAWASLILTAERDGVYLEGNILKVLDPGESTSYKAYLDKAVTTDKDKRELRLGITKQVQDQNKELLVCQRCKYMLIPSDSRQCYTHEFVTEIFIPTGGEK